MKTLDSVAILYWYDGPLIYWASKNEKQYIVFAVDFDDDKVELFFAFEVDRDPDYYKVFYGKSLPEWKLRELTLESKKGFVVTEDFSKVKNGACTSDCASDWCDGDCHIEDYFLIQKELVGDDIPEEYFPGQL